MKSIDRHSIKYELPISITISIMVGLMAVICLSKVVPITPMVFISILGLVSPLFFFFCVTVYIFLLELVEETAILYTKFVDKHLMVYNRKITLVEKLFTLTTEGKVRWIWLWFTLLLLIVPVSIAYWITISIVYVVKEIFSPEPKSSYTMTKATYPRYNDISYTRTTTTKPATTINYIPFIRPEKVVWDGLVPTEGKPRAKWPGATLVASKELPKVPFAQPRNTEK